MPAPLPPRRGPRPLPLHLALARLPGLAARMQPPFANASQTWNSGWPLSKAGQAQAQHLRAALAAAGATPEAFAAALTRAEARGDAALLAGIAGYRAHPYRRRLAPMPALWSEGGSCLRDYGGAGPVVLVVPSLINRAEVLDLLPDASCLRWLAGQGVRPLLLDWGAPGPLEQGFGLTDYIAGRLDRALDAAVAAAGGPVLVLGYCMGGLLALALAQRRPAAVAGLALLATPWDFHAEGPARPQALAALLPALAPWLAAGSLPVDVLQALFALLDPFAVGDKYRAFARLDPDGAAARRFVALEDWLNDGVVLAAPVARECLGGWYGANSPARGAWHVAGAPVRPAAIACPAFLAIPARDRLVPPASARALAAALPRALLHEAASGHIGMVAGRGAEAALWRPLAGWLRSASLSPGGAAGDTGRKTPRGRGRSRPTSRQEKGTQT
jgi:pimeloyl-ACP methyl ester carboxylesterase